MYQTEPRTATPCCENIITSIKQKMHSHQTRSHFSPNQNEHASEDDASANDSSFFLFTAFLKSRGISNLPSPPHIFICHPSVRHCVTAQDCGVNHCLHCSNFPAQTEIETGRSVRKVTMGRNPAKVSRHIQLGLKKCSTVNHGPSVKRICRASNPAMPGTIIVYENQDMFAS